MTLTEDGRIHAIVVYDNYTGIGKLGHTTVCIRLDDGVKTILLLIGIVTIVLG